MCFLLLSDIFQGLLFSQCENIQSVIFTVWKVWKLKTIVTSRRVLHAVLVCKIWKTKENVINRTFNGLTMNMEFISLERQDYLIFSLVPHSRENKNIRSHSCNKFHIQRQTIEYPLHDTLHYMTQIYLSKTSTSKNMQTFFSKQATWSSISHVFVGSSKHWFFLVIVNYISLSFEQGVIVRNMLPKWPFFSTSRLTPNIC